MALSDYGPSKEQTGFSAINREAIFKYAVDPDLGIQQLVSTPVVDQFGKHKVFNDVPTAVDTVKQLMNKYPGAKPLWNEILGRIREQSPGPDPEGSLNPLGGPLVPTTPETIPRLSPWTLADPQVGLKLATAIRLAKLQKDMRTSPLANDDAWITWIKRFTGEESTVLTPETMQSIANYRKQAAQAKTPEGRFRAVANAARAIANQKFGEHSLVYQNLYNGWRFIVGAVQNLASVGTMIMSPEGRSAVRNVIDPNLGLTHISNAYYPSFSHSLGGVTLDLAAVSGVASTAAKAASKAFTKVATSMLAKGASRATVYATAFAGQAIHEAAFFATMEGLLATRDEFNRGDNTLEDLGNILYRTGHGAITGALLGLFNFALPKIKLPRAFRQLSTALTFGSRVTANSILFGQPWWQLPDFGDPDQAVSYLTTLGFSVLGARNHYNISDFKQSVNKTGFSADNVSLVNHYLQSAFGATIDTGYPDISERHLMTAIRKDPRFANVVSGVSKVAADYWDGALKGLFQVASDPLYNLGDVSSRIVRVLGDAKMYEKLVQAKSILEKSANSKSAVTSEAAKHGLDKINKRLDAFDARVIASNPWMTLVVDIAGRLKRTGLIDDLVEHIMTPDPKAKRLMQSIEDYGIYYPSSAKEIDVWLHGTTAPEKLTLGRTKIPEPSDVTRDHLGAQGGPTGDVLSFATNPDYVNNNVVPTSPSFEVPKSRGSRIYPGKLLINKDLIFDYRNPKHISKLIRAKYPAWREDFVNRTGVDPTIAEIRSWVEELTMNLREGAWVDMEVDPDIRALFAGALVSEGEATDSTPNLALFPGYEQHMKSAIDYNMWASRAKPLVGEDSLAHLKALQGAWESGGRSRDPVTSSILKMIREMDPKQLKGLGELVARANEQTTWNSIARRSYERITGIDGFTVSDPVHATKLNTNFAKTRVVSLRAGDIGPELLTDLVSKAFKVISPTVLIDTEERKVSVRDLNKGIEQQQRVWDELKKDGAVSTARPERVKPGYDISLADGTPTTFTELVERAKSNPIFNGPALNSAIEQVKALYPKARTPKPIKIPLVDVIEVDKEPVAINVRKDASIRHVISILARKYKLDKEAVLETVGGRLAEADLQLKYKFKPPWRMTFDEFKQSTTIAVPDAIAERGPYWTRWGEWTLRSVENDSDLALATKYHEMISQAITRGESIPNKVLDELPVTGFKNGQVVKLEDLKTTRTDEILAIRFDNKLESERNSMLQTFLMEHQGAAGVLYKTLHGRQLLNLLAMGVGHKYLYRMVVDGVERDSTSAEILDYLNKQREAMDAIKDLASWGVTTNQLSELAIHWMRVRGGDNAGVGRHVPFFRELNRRLMRSAEWFFKHQGPGGEFIYQHAIRQKRLYMRELLGAHNELLKTLSRIGGRRTREQITRSIIKGERHVKDWMLANMTDELPTPPANIMREAREKASAELEAYLSNNNFSDTKKARVRKALALYYEMTADMWKRAEESFAPGELAKFEYMYIPTVMRPGKRIADFVTKPVKGAAYSFAHNLQLNKAMREVPETARVMDFNKLVHHYLFDQGGKLARRRYFGNALDRITKDPDWYLQAMDRPATEKGFRTKFEELASNNGQLTPLARGLQLLHDTGGDVPTAVKHLAIQFGDRAGKGSALAGSLRIFQAATKIVLAGVNQFAQPVNAKLFTSLDHMAKGLLRSFQDEKLAQRAGVAYYLANHTAGIDAVMYAARVGGGKTFLAEMYKRGLRIGLTPFAFTDRLAKKVVYHIGRATAEGYAERYEQEGLTEGLRDTIRVLVGDKWANNEMLSAVVSGLRDVSDRDLELAKQGHIPKKASIALTFMHDVGLELTRRTQFLDPAEQTPIDWSHPWVGVLTQFKSFIYMQAKMWADAMKMKEFSLVNNAMATMIMMMLVGEGVWDSRMVVSGNFDQLTKRFGSGSLVARAIQNILSAGGLGIGVEILNQLTTHPSNMTIASTLLGPTGTDVIKLLHGVASTLSWARGEKLDPNLQLFTKVMPFYSVWNHWSKLLSF